MFKLPRWFFADKKHKVLEPVEDTVLIRKGNDLYADGLVKIDKKISGDLYTLGEVIVTEAGELSGNMHCARCTINGKVGGNLFVSGHTEIKAAGRISGNIYADAINIELGAVVSGRITVEPQPVDSAILKRINKELQAAENVNREPVVIEPVTVYTAPVVNKRSDHLVDEQPNPAWHEVFKTDSGEKEPAATPAAPKEKSERVVRQLEKEDAERWW